MSGDPSKRARREHHPSSRKGAAKRAEKAARLAHEQRTKREVERLPEHLGGLCRFSRHRQLKRWKVIREAIESTEWLKAEMDAFLAEFARRRSIRPGRKVGAGQWHYAYIAYLLSTGLDLHRWWDESTTPEFWADLGVELTFAERCHGEDKPSYDRVWRMFARLEEYTGEVERIAQMVIAKAKEHDPQLGRFLHMDGTEMLTAARVERYDPDAPVDREGKRRRTRNSIQRISADEARKQRQKDVEEDDDQSEDEPSSNRHLVEGVARELISGEIEHGEIRDGYLYFRTKKGQWYRTRDIEAGLRMYSRGKGGHVWHGRYHGKIICHRYGAPIAVGTWSASQNESTRFEWMLKKALKAVGRPDAVITDAGLTTKAISGSLVRRGVTHIAPPRNVKAYRDHERFDRHGVVRCKYCGGPADRVGYDETNRGGIYRCREPRTECKDAEGLGRRHRAPASLEHRLLGPIQGCSELYVYLLEAQHIVEHVHRAWRERYGVAGKTYDSIPMRVSPGVGELRSQFALLVEWVRISIRMGWMESSATQTRYQDNPIRWTGMLDAAMADMWIERADAGLEDSYGPLAAERGWGPEKPPQPKRRR